MFVREQENRHAGAPGDPDERLRSEERYHRRVRELHQQTASLVHSLQERQVIAQQQAVVSMTRALERLVATTTEMVGFMVGTLIAGGQQAGQNMLAGFLDLLGQFSVMMGSMAIAASKVLESLFTGNPIGLFVGGLAMIAVGGLIKAFASQLKSRGAGLGSGSAGYGGVPLGGGAATGAPGFGGPAPAQGDSGGQVVYYFHFEGGVYDERGLARIAATALNRHAGRTAPKIARLALEGN